LPVIVLMPAGQQATTLQITDSGKTDINVQISALSSQPPDSTEVLMPPDTVPISPPVAAITPGATLTVGLVLSHPRQAKIGTYRVVLGSSHDLAER
jgi:P pilus assembly chaperone PapD